MALKGNLNSVDLANVFQMLSINRKEGTLNIFDGDTRKSIYFSKDGVSMLSRGSADSDSLGRILLRFQRITEEDLQSARNLQEQDNKPLWAVLEETAMVPREVIQDALRLEIEEEIYNLFIWKDASFEFIEGAPTDHRGPAEGDLSRLTFNVNSLIMEAARRIDESEMIQSRVDSVRVVFRYTGRNMDLTDPIFEEPWCDRVLAAIDGRSDIEKIIDSSYVSKFEVLKILALLVDAGAVEPLPADELMREGTAALERGDVEQGIRFLERVAEVGAESPDQQLALAAAYEGAGEFKAAADLYRRLTDQNLAAGNAQEAFDISRKIVTMLPTDLAASDRLIRIYTENQRDLEDCTEEIVERARVVAGICLELARTEQAIEVLQRAIGLAPEEFALRHLLVSVYLSGKMSVEAVAEYQTMVDWYSQRKDWPQVTNLLRKILVIDRSRADVRQRLEHLLTRQEHKSRGLKRVAIAFLVCLVLGGFGYAYITYELDGKATLAAEEKRAGKALAEMSKNIAQASARLSQLQDELSKGDLNVVSLVATYREAEALLDRFSVQIDQDIKELMTVAEKFRYTSAYKDSVRKQEELNVLKERFESSVAAARDEIQECSVRLVGDAEKLLMQGEPSAALIKYQRATDMAIDHTPLQNLNVPQKIEELKKSLTVVADRIREMDNLFDDGRFGDAREIAIALIRDYYLREVLDRVRVPLRVNSWPAGAEIHVNGMTTGKLTPSWIRWRPGADAIVELRHSGFARSGKTVLRLDLKQRETEILRLSEQEEIVVDLVKEVDWQEGIEGSVEGLPAVSGDHVFLATRSSLVYRIKPKQRAIEEVYRADSLSGIAAGVAVRDGHLYLATIEGSVQRISLATRLPTWSKRVPGSVYRRVVLAGEFVIVCDDSRRVTAFDAVTGKQAWQTLLPAEVRGDPVVHQGRVYVTGEDGHCYGLSVARGRKEFDVMPRGAAGSILGGPSISGSRLHLVSTTGTVHAFDLESGRELWNYATGAEIKTTPTSFGRMVIVATSNGRVYALRDGAMVDSFELKRPLRTAPAHSGNRLFFAGDDGLLTAMDFKDDRFHMVWRLELGEDVNRILVPATAVGDRILVASEDGQIFVLRK